MPHSAPLPFSGDSANLKAEPGSTSNIDDDLVDRKD